MAHSTTVLLMILSVSIGFHSTKCSSLRIARSEVDPPSAHSAGEQVNQNYTLVENTTQSPSPHGGGDIVDKTHHQGERCDNYEHCDSGNESASHGIHLISLKYEYVKQPFIISVFLLAAGLSKLAFHHAHWISSRVPESCLLIILGILVGVLMHKIPTTESALPGLSSKLFFLYLLPPIILESAYSLHDRTFYENVGTVLLFAVIGTVLNCFLIGPTLYGMAAVGAMGQITITMKQCLVFSSIIVAVDPVAVLAIFQEIGVNNVLYFLVFGESLLNDAVTVVLYNMMNEFNNMPFVPAAEVLKGLAAFFIVSLGGLSIGIVFGVMTAIITKYTGTVRVVEPLAVFVLAYISYIVAELFHFSGIISIIGCGLTQAQYAFHNISQKSHTTVKYFSKMISATSDCIIFLFLGIALLRSDIQNLANWNIYYILWAIFLCLAYRFIVVFGLTWLVNRSSRMRRIDNEEKFIMAYGGLRGAVAFSLMDLLPLGLHMSEHQKSMFMTTCLSIIFFTVFVQGITIKPLVKLLRVKLQEEKGLKLSEEINSHVTDHVMAGIEEVLGQHGEHYLREILEFYNRKYIKKLLMKDPVSMDEQIMNCFEEIALQQHFENLAGSKMIQEKYSSSDNLPLPEDIRAKLNDSIPEEDEESISSEGSDSGDDKFTVLPAVTVRPPSTPSLKMSMNSDINDEQRRTLIEENLKMRRQTADKTPRKSSILPSFLRPKDTKSVSDEPTAKEVRAMFTPSRRMLQHRKLDKNIRDESSTDLLKFLQEKQLRTRRMSRAIAAFKDAGKDSAAGSPVSTPLGSDLNLSQPRKSVDATTAMQNYRRRLSLAVPARPAFQRDRSPSDITHLKLMNQPRLSPLRKRKFLKKGHSFHSGDADKESPNSLKPTSDQLLKSPSKVSKTSGFDSINENEEDGHDHSLDDTKSTISTSSTVSSQKRRAKFQKSKTVDLGHQSESEHLMQRSDTEPIEAKRKDKSKVHFEEENAIKRKKPTRRNLEKTLSLDMSGTPDVNEDDPRIRSFSFNEGTQLRKASYSQAVSGDKTDDLEMKNLVDKKS